jgi:hypothetical protein
MGSAVVVTDAGRSLYVLVDKVVSLPEPDAVETSGFVGSMCGLGLW